MYYRFLSEEGEKNEEIERAGIVGDMMLIPLGPDGPMEVDSGTRALTLINADELQKLIESGLHVLLTLGPCGVCHKPKTEILKTILDLENKLITHLVVDSLTASELLNKKSEGRLLD